MTQSKKIAVIGGGAWGTALAQTVRRTGNNVVLWAREGSVVDAINQRHENTVFLPGEQLDPKIRATGELDAAARDADLIVLVVPAQHLRSIAAQLSGCIQQTSPILIATKGIEIETGATMMDVAAEMLPGVTCAILSGPTFAAEVARGLPTAVTVAGNTEADASAIAAMIGTPVFRPYVSTDPVGCAIGGAVKNVLAIACGIVWGRKLGDNARAALITRGLTEMGRLSVALGGQHATLMGLSGLGDLVLTATGMQSRNCSLGVALGEGRRLQDVLDQRQSVAEGVTTAQAVCRLAHRLGIEMPISASVNAILHEGASIDEVIQSLLARPTRSESHLV